MLQSTVPKWTEHYSLLENCVENMESSTIALPAR